MSLNKRIAVTLPAGPRLSDTIALINWAESQGIGDGWFADAGAPDALTSIAAIAHHTRDMRIGVAVTPVYSRSPAVLAATAEAISQVLPGRFVLGLGSSSQTIVEQWHGIPLHKPLTRVRETATLVRSMLRGEKTGFAGDTVYSRGYRQAPCENPPPIYLAALRAKMIEMAAEVGDGVIFNLWPRGALSKMMDHVRIGAERGGKDWRGIEIVNRAMVLVTDDKSAGRDLFRAAFSPYYATPVYNAFLAWAGYEEAAAAIRKGWAERDREKTAAALGDELVDEIAVIGPADEVRQRLREDAAGGIHTHIIAPLAPDPDSVMRTLEAVTPARFAF
jgi:probable F420-dependent oxidoreductase